MLTVALENWEWPYFFGYKTVFFPFQNNPKNLDPSYKADLELFRKGRTCIIAKLHMADVAICSHSSKGKILSYSPINMVILKKRIALPGSKFFLLRVATSKEGD